MVYYFLGDIVTMNGENVFWIRFGNTGLNDISCKFTDLDRAICEVTVGLFEKISLCITDTQKLSDLALDTAKDKETVLKNAKLGKYFLFKVDTNKVQHLLEQMPNLMSEPKQSRYNIIAENNVIKVETHNINSAQ